ncbi:MAG TPA: alpha/beta hydrolase [Saprospiraceae bacterium]|nr:alpha/beta hydrolase [Saprospiraceae bacterium]
MLVLVHSKNYSFIGLIAFTLCVPFFFATSIFESFIEKKVTPSDVMMKYIEIPTMDKSKYELITGSFEVRDNGDIIKGNSDQNLWEDALKDWKLSLAEKPANRQKILIYIHGMWAHRPWIQNAVMTKYYDSVFNQENNPYGLVISLTWQSGLSYWENKENALNTGHFFGQILEQLRLWDHAGMDILAHSMGNRVLQGIYESLDEKECYPRIFNTLYMHAADLEVNIFQPGEPMDSITYIADSIWIYIHQNDRTLGMSRSINKNDRLGLNPSPDATIINDRIRMIDVSLIDDNEGIGPNLSNHRYFYSSATVRRDMMLQMTGACNDDRYPSSKKGYFILQPYLPHKVP